MTNEQQTGLSNTPQPYYLVLGKVLRPHGVRGELRVQLMTDYPERIANLEFIYLGSDPMQEKADRYHLKAMRRNKGYGLLTLHGIRDRNTAETLRDLLVMVDIAHAVPLDEGEIYLYQLIGMCVHTDAGSVLGDITDIIETGANDVYVVQSEDYGEILIPITDETLIETNINARKIVVKLPEGLLPDSQ